MKYKITYKIMMRGKCPKDIANKREEKLTTEQKRKNIEQN